MGETRSISVRLKLDQYQWLQEVAGGGPIATEIKKAIDFYISSKEIVWLEGYVWSEKSEKSDSRPMFVTTQFAAKLLGIDPKNVRKKCRNGTLRAIKPAKQWLIFASEIPNLFRPNVVRQD